jgi:protocatechuate 3,4-dioxygenase beta subunit
VRGVVFDDRNGNGVQDGGDPGVSGVSVTLAGVGTVTTDAAGAYDFTAVEPGPYTLAIALPAGYNAVTPLARAIDLPAGGSAQVDFALQAQGIVQGVVFEDRNGNGSPDSGDPGIGGVTVTLSGVGAVTTAADGTYRFLNVVPGNYTLSITLPAEYTLVSLSERQVGLASGGSAVANFALQARGTIQGVVFDDRNGNGIPDSGDPGLGGVTVTLDGQAAVVTAADGSYRFDKLSPGAYTVAVTPPVGYTNVTFSSVVVAVSSQTSAVANFALQPSGSIVGAIFEDLNNNGQRDGGEQGVAGVVVSLSTGLTVTTGTTGDFSFTALPPGVYRVAVGDIVATGYTLITPDAVDVVLAAGSSGSVFFGVLPQDAIVGTGVPGSEVQLEAGQLLSQANAPLAMLTTTVSSLGVYIFTGLEPGIYQLSFIPPPGFTAVVTTTSAVLSAGGAARVDIETLTDGVIQGVIFEDLNADGVQAATEQALGGVTVRLLDGASVPLTSTESTASGRYQFTDLSAGSYLLEVVADGFSTPPVSAVALTVSAPGANVDVGLRRPRSLSGSAFRDDDGDQERDLNEPGLPNVTVQVQGANGTQVALTMAGGLYRLDDLADGSYVIGALAPEGFFPTTPDTTDVVIAPEQPAPVVNFGYRRTPVVTHHLMYLPLVGRLDRVPDLHKLYLPMVSTGPRASGE